MNKVFSDEGWADYRFWQTQEKKTLKRISTLLQDSDHKKHQGIGNPEPFKGVQGYWSRRINEKDRLVYKIADSEILIAQCRTHYGDH